MRTNFLSPCLAGIDLAPFMHEALREAEQAGLSGELPIGAVLVIDGHIIARGRSQRKRQQCQLMHAEMDALLHGGDRKSTRLNSSHANISYAVFCLKKKKESSTNK